MKWVDEVLQEWAQAVRTGPSTTIPVGVTGEKKYVFVVGKPHRGDGMKAAIARYNANRKTKGMKR